jgi:hypothetical protein
MGDIGAAQVEDGVEIFEFQGMGRDEGVPVIPIDRVRQRLAVVANQPHNINRLLLRCSNQSRPD